MKFLPLSRPQTLTIELFHNDFFFFFSAIHGLGPPDSGFGRGGGSPSTTPRSFWRRGTEPKEETVLWMVTSTQPGPTQLRALRESSRNLSSFTLDTRSTIIHKVRIVVTINVVLRGPRPCPLRGRHLKGLEKLRPTHVTKLLVDLTLKDRTVKERKR